MMACQLGRLLRDVPVVALVLPLLAGKIIFGTAAADELALPQSLPATGAVEAVYRFDSPTTGRGFLDVEWTDVDGRMVERRRIPLDLTDASTIAFPLDPRRAVSVKNRLAATLSIEAPKRFQKKADAAFIVSPPGSPWSDYQIIMFQEQTPAGYVALKRLGITAGAVMSDRNETPGAKTMKQVEVMLDNDLRWYLENTATDFYSAYHRWFPDRPVNWRFLETQRRYWANPADIGSFMREPSLSDEQWLKKIRNRLINDVLKLRRYRPLYYDLADEPGIADLAAFWDFDLSPPSLAAMRDWLKTRYVSLAQLNQEWGSAFASWDKVTPMTTAEALEQRGQNFAAWGDFKEWMDVAFARAVEVGAAAVHRADPHALAAIEGGQIPGWGGYDYSRLANSIDAIEPYDYGDAVEMIRSFNPRAVILTTSSGGGAPEAHRVWRELLRGTRGLLLWDSAHEFVDKDGRLGERAREAAPYFGEIRSGLGSLLMNSKRHLDPIGILYSPASWRIEWLLDRRKAGGAWSHRSAGSEYGNDAVRTSTWNYLRAIEHMGLQPRFVSAGQVEQGELERRALRVLILPQTIALSSRAADEIRAFVRAGGTAVADGEPGLFDQHGRRRARPALADLFQEAPTGSTKTIGPGRAVASRAPNGRDEDARQRLTALLAAAGVRPMFPLTREDSRPVDDVESYVFVDGGLRILALLREPPAYSASAPSYGEPAGLAGGRQPVLVDLRHPYEVYDIRAHRALGRRSRVRVELGPVAPVILALAAKPLPEPSISGPHSAHVGENAEFHISASGPPGTAEFDVVHLVVSKPDGSVVPYYSGNLLARGGAGSKLLPLAADDATGLWSLRATSLLSGMTAQAPFLVEP